MTGTTTTRAGISAAAAVHVEQAIDAAERGQRGRAIGHLLAIDETSWPGIRERLGALAPDIGAWMRDQGVPAPHLTHPQD